MRFFVVLLFTQLVLSTNIHAVPMDGNDANENMRVILPIRFRYSEEALARQQKRYNQKRSRKVQKGDLVKQYQTGLQYFFGYDVEQNMDEALKLFQEAAKGGNDDAQYYLGYCYELGRGVQKNVHKALYWYSRASEQGNLRAKTSFESLSKVHGHENSASIVAQMSKQYEFETSSLSESQNQKITAPPHFGHSPITPRQPFLPLTMENIHQTLIFKDGSASSHISHHIQFASTFFVNNFLVIAVYCPLESIINWVVNCNDRQLTLLVKRETPLGWKDMLIQASWMTGTCDNSKISTSNEKGYLEVSVRRI